MSPGGAPDRWLVLEVARPEDDETAGFVVEELMGLPVRGVVESDDSLIVYLPPPEYDDAEELVRSVRERIQGVVAMDDVRVSHHWQAHEAWEETWRQGLDPRRVTDRLVVAPSWTDPDLEPGELLLTVDPGMAFGTAEHASTRGSLRLLDHHLRPGDRIVDVGAGSGILAIAGVRLGADSAMAIEMDPWACHVIRENAELNGVADQVSVLNQEVGPDLLASQGPFDGVVANIETGTLVQLLPGFRACLHPEGGWLILAGILQGEAGQILRAADEEGFDLVSQDREDGWWSGAFQAGV